MPCTFSLAPPGRALVRQERAGARQQLPLRRSSHLRGYAAERLVRPGLLITWLQLSISMGYEPYDAHLPISFGLCGVR